MTTTCPKCAYTRQPADTAPEYECPKCGIIYAKFRATTEVPDAWKGAAASSASSPRRIGRNLLWIALVVFCVAGGTYGYTWKQEQDAIAARKQQREQEVTATRASLGKLNDMGTRFLGALELADSTSRIALAGPVKDLQEIAREVKSLEPAGCAKFAHEALVLASGNAVSGFLAFMKGAEYKHEASAEFDLVADHMKTFREQTGLCLNTLEGA